MNVMRAVLALPILLLAPGCIVIEGSECRHSEPREAVLPAAAGVRTVEVRALAGSLSIAGQSGAGEVRAEGVACARRRRDLESIDLEARREGDRIVIEAVIAQAARRRGARLDLSIRAPADVELVVSDTSGVVEIVGVESVKLDDASGDVWLERIAGDVVVIDRSGDVEVYDVGGALRVDDGSGDVVIRGAAAVTIVSDGSGDLEIEDVVGDVTILDDGSGDIEVRRIGGDLRVDDDGSGEIEHAEIGGSVEIR